VISTFGLVVAASAIHDVVLYSIYAFSAVLLTVPLLMTGAMLSHELRHVAPRRRRTVYALAGVVGLTTAGALAIVLTQ